MAEMVKTKTTLDAFFQLPESVLPTELIHGEVITTPAPDEPHQKVAFNAVVALTPILPEGTLRFAPIDLVLDDETVVQPDILWVSKDNPRCRLVDGRRWHGAPDLVIEILSPSTARRDKKTKFELYQKHGVREYWMVDPVAEYVEAWGLQGERFEKIGIFGPGETFASPVLNGQTLDVSAFFKT